MRSEWQKPTTPAPTHSERREVITTDYVLDEVFEAVAKIPGYVPYEGPEAREGAFILDAGRPNGPIEERAVFVVSIEGFNFEPED
jgi:hypothetical protein